MKKKDRDNEEVVGEADENILEVQNRNVMKFKRKTSSGAKNKLQKVQNVNPSSTEINKTEIINTERLNRELAYGKFYNVFLKEEELEFLQAEHPDGWQQWIERLPEYMASSGKKYE